jgi:hypothetical protein
MGDFESLGVRNKTVWKQIKYMLLGAAFLFLINNYFGFDNALTEGDLPRWQVLIHLHAGSIGWITLSVIAMTVWIYSGTRELSETYVNRVKTLTWFVILAFGGYIISFGVAFSQGSSYFFLLPIFGTLSAATIWIGLIFSITQFRRSEVKTAPQLMVMCALIIASLGALMGLLLGLESALEISIIPGADRIGAHAAVMDSYLLLAASAIVGWFLGRNSSGKYSRGALAQALILTAGPILAWLGLILDVEPLLGASAPLFLVAAIIFAVRNARGVLKLNPLRKGPGGWVFFGSIWTVLWAFIFVYLISIFLTEGPEGVSPGLIVLFVHAGFIGAMTNLILGVLSVRAYAARNVLSWAEPVALWLMNLGLILFVVLKFAADSRLGSIVMGIGIVLGVLTMIVRLLSKNEAPEPAAVAGD